MLLAGLLGATDSTHTTVLTNVCHKFKPCGFAPTAACQPIRSANISSCTLELIKFLIILLLKLCIMERRVLVLKWSSVILSLNDPHKGWLTSLLCISSYLRPHFPEEIHTFKTKPLFLKILCHCYVSFSRFLLKTLVITDTCMKMLIKLTKPALEIFNRELITWHDLPAVGDDLGMCMYMKIIKSIASGRSAAFDPRNPLCTHLT